MGGCGSLGLLTAQKFKWKDMGTCSAHWECYAAFSLPAAISPDWKESSPKLIRTIPVWRALLTSINLIFLPVARSNLYIFYLWSDARAPAHVEVRVRCLPVVGEVGDKEGLRVHHYHPTTTKKHYFMGIRISNKGDVLIRILDDYNFLLSHILQFSKKMRDRRVQGVYF